VKKILPAMQALKQVGRRSGVPMEGFEETPGGAAGDSHLINDVIEREAFQFLLLSQFLNARGPKERGCVAATAGPALALPRVESRGALGDFIHGLAGRAVGEGLAIDEGSAELCLGGTIRDTPGTQGIVKIFLAIHRAGVEMAAGFATATAGPLGFDQAAACHWVRMVTKSGERHGVVHSPAI